MNAKKFQNNFHVKAQHHTQIQLHSVKIKHLHVAYIKYG